VAEATPAADAKPEEPAAPDTGPKPEKETPAPKETKAPDDAYVKSLRKEAADTRKALEAANARLREIEDRDKSEAEKASERVAASERRAVEAEAKLLRLEVAAARRFKASAVDLLTGTTREEIEASADKLAAVLKENETPAPGFDGGARTTPAETKSPELAHNDWLMRALGRVSD
jgi:hypothetical protein